MMLDILDTGIWGASATDDRNRITYSALLNCHIENYNAPTYSIKYVLQGTEHYFLNKRKYSVGERKFLLVNGGDPVDIAIHSKKAVEGICIHLKPDLVKEVYRTLVLEEEKLLDQPCECIDFPSFQSLIYSDQENVLGQHLYHFARAFDKDTASLEADETEVYYLLCKQLLKLQHKLPNGSGLNLLRNSTQKELLSRLVIAKELMDDVTSENLSIERIALTAMLSPSHLFRSFKKLYGKTPYQYMLDVKLNKAKSLLNRGEHTITEVAFMLGFADLPTFSKQFKKRYGCAPGKLREEL